MSKVNKTLYTLYAADRDNKSRLTFTLYRLDAKKSPGLSMAVWGDQPGPLFTTGITKNFIEVIRLFLNKLTKATPGTTLNVQIQDKGEDQKYHSVGSMTFGIDETSTLYIHVQNQNVNTRFPIRNDLKFDLSANDLSRAELNSIAAATLMNALTAQATTYIAAFDAQTKEDTEDAGAPPTENTGGGYSNRQGGGGYSRGGGGGNWQRGGGGYSRGGGGNYGNRGGSYNNNGGGYNRQGGGYNNGNGTPPQQNPSPGGAPAPAAPPPSNNVVEENGIQY